MCQFIAFMFDPKTAEIKVHDLQSHSGTESALKLDKSVWREGHWTPNNELVLRTQLGDEVLPGIEKYVRELHGDFCGFMKWCLEETKQDEIFTGSLYLSGLTSLKPGCLPQSVGGSLDLSGLTSLKPGCLPQSVGGYLYLSGLTSLKPGCLPQSVGGYLYLSGLKTETKNMIKLERKDLSII